MKKKVLAILLVLAMLLALAGCGSGDTEKLVGKWRCEIDMTDFLMEKILEDSGEMAQYFELNDVVVIYYADFRSDSTVRMYAEEQQVNDLFEKLEDRLMDGLALYMVDLFYEQTGIIMTMDEILELSGTNEEDFRDSLGFDQIARELVENLYMEGKYKAEEGKLYISAGLDYNFDPGVYEIYSLDGTVFTISDCVGSEIAAFNPYPMVFHKIG